MPNDPPPPPLPSDQDPLPDGQILIYRDGSTHLQVRLEGQTVWLTQRLMADLYQVSVKTVNEHLINIYEEGELGKEATVRSFRIVQTEGTRDVARHLDHYNLDSIIAVGFRVRTARGVAFRQWAIAQLRELLVKGFVMDDKRLKEGKSIGADYFEELLERIRDIRASEKRFYQKITDIYATATDYDSTGPAARSFFAKVQNKLEWAVTGMTGPEIIKSRADADKFHMGLATWKNAPAGPVRKADANVAKNYLSQEELSELNRIVTMYLDFAEDQAKQHQSMSMAQWADKLDAFLTFTGREVLTHAGKVTRTLADAFAKTQFTTYQPKQRAQQDQTPSDFDRFIEEDVKRLEGEKGGGDG